MTEKQPWISVEDDTPYTGGEYRYLITDGTMISLGWWEDEHMCGDPKGCWHDDAGLLFWDACGQPLVTHFRDTPDLPRVEALSPVSS